MTTRTEALGALRSYMTRIQEAVARKSHHDQRRAILQEFLRDGFDLTVDEIELERHVRAAKSRGRVDLLYRTLVWEVKRDLDNERADLERELRLYLADTAERTLGIGTDGLRFEVYHLRDGELRRIDALNMAADGITHEDIIDWLDSYIFGLDMVTPTAETIIARFGLGSSVYLAAQPELEGIWDSIRTTSEAATKRREWERLLEVVYGTQVADDNLWIRHTYLVMVARLFAYLAILQEMPAPGTELGVLTGELFRPLGLENIVERDFFVWPAEPALQQKTRTILRGIARSLGTFDLSRIDEDLLKELYEHMVDPAEREWLGEFYTPDWLADYVLEKAEFNSATRMLDPSCGSGTFLFAAIRRLRAAGLKGASLVEIATRNILGMDIHPLAVTVARANYVLALRQDIRESTSAFQIPVYMADTLATPEETFGRPIRVPVPFNAISKESLPRWFELPTDTAKSGAYLEPLITLIDELTDMEMPLPLSIRALKARLVEVGEEGNAHIWEANLALLRELKIRGLDSVWGFVLRNSAKPQTFAAEKVDLIVGNPPWLTVMDMASRDYKDRAKQLARQFGLVPKAGSRMGNVSHIDTATIFAAYCAEYFLHESKGRVAFVLPRSVLTGATQHEPFRSGRSTLSYRPVYAADLDDVDPLFRIPACVMIFDKVPSSKKPEIPFVWPTEAISGRLPRKNASRSEAEPNLSFSPVTAKPVTSRHSPYLPDAKQGVDIRPRCFWIVEVDPKAQLIDRVAPYVRSLSSVVDRARGIWKGKAIAGRVEAKYLYCTALDLQPFRLGEMRLVVLPVRPHNDRLAVVDSAVAASQGDIYLARWLTQSDSIFRATMTEAERSSRWNVIQYLDTQGKLRDQSPDAPRVLWAKGGVRVRAAVAPHPLPKVAGFEVQGYVVDLNHYYIECKSWDEAHYLCALLNAKIVSELVSVHQTRGEFGNRDIHRRPFQHVPIPRFDSNDPCHLALARLSREAHQLALDVEITSRNQDAYRSALGVPVAEIDSLAEQVLDI
jgi:Type I restriction-modification system methyltransferase subunit